MFSFRFNCPHCSSDLEAQDEWRGMETQCPQCNATITIPKWKTLKDSAKARSQEKRSTIQIPFSKGGLIILLLAIIGVIFYLVRSQIRENTKEAALFNEAQWRTPSGNIRHEFIESTGNVVYTSKSYASAVAHHKRFYVQITPEFKFSKNNKKELFLKFSSSKGFLDNFRVRFSSGAEAEFSVNKKDKIANQYMSFSKIKPADYIKYFVNDTPVNIQVSLPLFEKGKMLEIHLENEQKLAFRDMASFFKGGNPPEQVASVKTSSDSVGPRVSNVNKNTTQNTTASTHAETTLNTTDVVEKLQYGDPAANRKLLQAIKNGDAIAVDESLLEGASLYARDQYDRNIADLVKLSQNRQIDARIMEQYERMMTTLPKIKTRKEALWLISIGLHPNYEYGDKVSFRGVHYTPLHVCKTVEVASVFIEHGAKTSGPYSKATYHREPLHTHVLQGNVEIVKLLIANGANLKSTDVNGKTPLDLCKDEATRQVLIEAMNK